MSVIIKGMKMPKSCRDCWMQETDPAHVLCDLRWQHTGYNTGRHPDCPLVEINSPIDFQRFIDDEIQRIIEGDKE